jgi:phage repressor protein C with HTH and peptisase S24 domain
MYLKKIRLLRKLTQEELARKVGVSKSNLSLIESGKLNIKIEKAEKLAVALNCKTTDLTGTTQFNPEITSRMIPIKYYDINASVGNGYFVNNENFEVIQIDEIQLKKIGIISDFESISIINAKGDSMSPTIKDGDLLFVNTNKKEIYNKKIYVINEDNLLKVKRIIKESPLDNKITIKSDNEIDGEYPPYPITIDESKNIICGMVIFYCRNIE